MTFPFEPPLGARVAGDGRLAFRVWAPRAERSVELELRGERRPMSDAGFGVFVVECDGAAGEDYRFVLDGGEPLPDPASRWQPEGLRGPSRVVAAAPPSPLEPPPALDELVLYELHVGTFSSEGTFAGVVPHLAELAELGVNAVEIMPVAEFPGTRGWGYDGVYLSAAQSSYGGPEGLRELVAAAHAVGLAVILDVVYNHVGASGLSALEAFGPYFTEKYETPWGRAINFDDAGCDAVREWVLQSACGWIADCGIDGLRLDAIHAVFDSSPEHLVAAVARRVHEVRSDALVIAESGLNDPRVVRPAPTGWGCDAAWADDFHHSVRTLVAEEREGYYAEFGRVADLAKSLERPFVHDGTWSAFRGRRFGAPADDVPPERFVVFDQNHDQVGNRAFGDRLPAPARPLAAMCTLLAPFTPMLFMGEEYGEDRPFLFFSDHIDREIADATREGRRAEFSSFASFAEEIPDPQDPGTFQASKLSRRPDRELAELYRALLGLRRELRGEAASEVEFDEDARWLRFRRGAHTMIAHFSSTESLELPAPSGATLVLAAGAGTLNAGRLRLGPLSGAVLR